MGNSTADANKLYRTPFGKDSNGLGNMKLLITILRKAINLYKINLHEVIYFSIYSPSFPNRDLSDAIRSSSIALILSAITSDFSGATYL